LCNIYVTPQRQTLQLQPIRIIFLDNNNNLEHFSNVTEKKENEIDLINDNDYS